MNYPNHVMHLYLIQMCFCHPANKTSLEIRLLALTLVRIVYCGATSIHNKMRISEFYNELREANVATPPISKTKR